MPYSASKNSSNFEKSWNIILLHPNWLNLRTTKHLELFCFTCLNYINLFETHLFLYVELPSVQRMPFALFTPGCKNPGFRACVPCGFAQGCPDHCSRPQRTGKCTIFFYGNSYVFVMEMDVPIGNGHCCLFWWKFLLALFFDGTCEHHLLYTNVASWKILGWMVF
jgi:hypothetical protein